MQSCPLLIVLLLIGFSAILFGHPDDITCYDDVCVREDAEVPTIWFNDRPDIFQCPQPYAVCDVGRLAFDFCHDNMGYNGSDRAVCAHNLWRMYALKEQLILANNFNLRRDTVNTLGFTRSNDWFETTLYLPGIMSKYLINQQGDEFLFAKPLRILEVGSYEGGSATWYIRYMLSHPNSTLTCIDPWSTSFHNGLNSSNVYDTFLSNIALTGVAPNKVRVFRNFSVPVLATLMLQGELFDHIYIDGSHLLENVIMDIGLAWRLLLPGGVMTLDDLPWRSKDPTTYATQEYSYSPPGTEETSQYPYCHRVGQRGYYKMEDSVAAYVSNLPGADVIYCGYHMALRKRVVVGEMHL